MLTLALTFPTWLVGILIALFVAASVLMVLMVLIQRPMGGGLSGAFGSGAGSGQTAFGAKTGDALTLATIIMFVVFVLGAILLNFALAPAAAPVEPSASSADTSETPESGEPPRDQPAGDTPPDNTPEGEQPGETPPAPTGEQPGETPPAPTGDGGGR